VALCCIADLQSAGEATSSTLSRRNAPGNTTLRYEAMATFGNILPKKGMRPKPGGSNVEIEMTGVETGMDNRRKSSNLPVTVQVSLNAQAQSYGTEKIRWMEMVVPRGGDRRGRHWRLVFQPR
jgi:hypothetical protein